MEAGTPERWLLQCQVSTDDSYEQVFRSGRVLKSSHTMCSSETHSGWTWGGERKREERRQGDTKVRGMKNNGMVLNGHCYGFSLLPSPGQGRSETGTKAALTE